MAGEEGPDCLQFKEQTVPSVLYGVQLVRFDASGQKCATSPPFPSVEARVVIDVLFTGIKEGRVTIDPRGVLECTVLLDHGRLMALLISEHATYGIDQLRLFMVSHRDELVSAHVHYDCALTE